MSQRRGRGDSVGALSPGRSARAAEQRDSDKFMVLIKLPNDASDDEIDRECSRVGDNFQADIPPMYSLPVLQGQTTDGSGTNTTMLTTIREELMYHSASTLVSSPSRYKDPTEEERQTLLAFPFPLLNRAAHLALAMHGLCVNKDGLQIGEHGKHTQMAVEPEDRNSDIEKQKRRGRPKGTGYIQQGGIPKKKGYLPSGYGPGSQYATRHQNSPSPQSFEGKGASTGGEGGVSSSEEEEALAILCDNCDNEYFVDEVGLDHIPEGQWFCFSCTSSNAAARSRMSSKPRKPYKPRATNTSNKFICMCGRRYKHASGLYNHKKVCSMHKGPEAPIRQYSANTSKRRQLSKQMDLSQAESNETYANEELNDTGEYNVFRDYDQGGTLPEKSNYLEEKKQHSVRGEPGVLSHQLIGPGNTFLSGAKMDITSNDAKSMLDDIYGLM